MPIDTSFDQATSITCHRVRGRMALEEMIDTVKTRYESGKDASRVLWDMTEADMTGLQPETVKSFMSVAARYAAENPDARIAIVATGDLQFGFARLSNAYADMEGAATQYSAFRTVADATDWLIGADNKSNGGVC